MKTDTKASLRLQARAILAGLSLEVRAAASAAIRARIVALPEWEAARKVAIYAAHPSEPDLSGLLEIPGKTFCFPRTNGAEMEFHVCHSRDLLRPGSWKVLEPDPEHCPVINASEIDLLFIPGQAFTRSGGRLGRGVGHYDRFLSRAHPKAVKVGVCFHAQLVPALPLEPHDLEMDLVLTEAEEIRHGKDSRG